MFPGFRRYCWTWRVSVQILSNGTVSTSMFDAVFLAWLSGMSILFFFLFACSMIQIPDLIMPPNTLLLRESFYGPGADRTGNWWGRFDDEGCWWEAHNTWLIVSDPILLESASWFMHWNAKEEQQPWFCLTGEQTEILRENIQLVREGVGPVRYTGPVERWTVQTPTGPISQVISRQSSLHKSVPLGNLFYRFSADGVWGQSPESDFVGVVGMQQP
jgi:hypothetical protein